MSLDLSSMFLYDGGREGFLGEDFNWINDDIVLYAVGPAYLPSTTDLDVSSLNDIVAGPSANFVGKTGDDGVAKASNVTFPLVPGGDEITGFVVVNASQGIGALDKRLIGYIGSDSAGGPISIDTDGGDIVVRFGGGTQRIFRL